MDDLIRRQDVIESILFATADGDKADWIISVINSVPSAEPVIIRCKECKWCREHYDTDGNAPYWTCMNWDCGTDADGFCYEAERKKDE